MENIFNKIMSIYSSIFFKEIEEMRNCNHFEGEGEVNPFHAEGDTWSHTVAVMTAAKINRCGNYWRQFIMAVACLTHDYGKVFSRNVKLTDTGHNKVTFYGHGEMSVQHAIDLALRLFQIEEFKSQLTIPLKNLILSRIVNLVGNHMNFYQVEIFEKAKLMANYDTHMLELFKHFEECDLNGSFSTMCHRRNSEHFNFDFEQVELDPNKPVVWVYMGLPGSGKDSHNAHVPHSVVSLDKARIEAHRDLSAGVAVGTPAQEYKMAWELCNRLNLNLSHDIVANLWVAKSKIKTHEVRVCNTHLNKKGRKETIRHIRDVFGRDVQIGCRFMVVSTDTAIRRDRNRTDKNVGEQVIRKMAMKIDPPTMAEGFNFVEYINNEDEI